ncbi:organic cation transporter protein-like [Rhodnius prolixus]|uniref:organic cation transporter protein-like n=1 Tax=Rhodnius prolixus TaxID=13249 RepID=UPI003D18B1D4
MTATGVTEKEPDKSTVGNKSSKDAESSSPSSTPPPDLISRCIGEYGKWQFLLTFLLSLLNFPCTFQIYSTTFEAAEGDFWCAKPPYLTHLSTHEWLRLSGTNKTTSDGKQVYNACLIKDINYTNPNLTSLSEEDLSHFSTKPCSRWEYDLSAFGETIISEWDLVCEKKQYGNLAEMAFLLGVAIGGLACGFISDRFGRKRTLMISIVAQIIFGTAVALAPHFWVFIALRGFLGFFSVSLVFSGFVLCVELVGGKWLTISGVSYLFPLPLSYVTISGIAYCIKGWRELQLAITLPSVCFLPLLWILPESPRWLLSMGKSEKVLKVLEDAAKFNKMELPASVDKLIKQEIAKEEGTENQSPKVGLLDLYRTPRMRRTSFLLYVLWFCVYIVYYGLVLNLSNLGGNVYINSVISGAFELPAIAVSILILLKLGRRWPLAITMAAAGCACLLTIPAPKDEGSWLVLGLATLGRFCASSSNVILPIFTADLFPTLLRNLGIGSSNAPSGIALIFVPYLWNMAGMNVNLPMAVLGVCGLVGSTASLFLPDRWQAEN